MTYCDCGDYCEWCHPEMILEEKRMIVNYYIQLPNKKNKETELFELQKFLISHGYQTFDATAYDSLVSGHCKLETLDEIERNLKGVLPDLEREHEAESDEEVPF